MQQRSASVGLIVGGALLVAGYGTVSAAREAGERHEPVRVEKTLPAEGVEQVRASVKIGSLRVEAGGRDAIEVTAVRTFGDLSDADARRWREESRVTIEQQGDAVVVEDIIPEENHRSSRGKSPRLEVTIRMPRRLALDAKTGVGNLEVTGEVGDVRVESGVGDVKLRRLACSGNSVTAKAGVGEMTVSLASLPREQVKAELGVGQLRVGLPASARASVHLSSGMGNVSSGFPLKKTPRGAFNFGGTQTGDLNGGGPSVRLNVGVGDVRLERE
jgi:hypothetical protein